MDLLFGAIISDNIKRIKSLLAKNRDVINKLNLGNPIKFENEIEMICALYLKFGEELAEYNKKRGRSILYEAIKYGKDIKIIETIIKIDKSCINRIDPSGLTPLLEAVKSKSDLSLIKLLVKNKANVNFCDNLGCSPLHYAEDLEIVKLLITYGARVNCGNNMNTPLIRAIQRHGDKSIIVELIKNGADVEARDANGRQTILHLALYYKCDEDVIDRICSKIHGYNDLDEDGMTPLCYAVTKTYLVTKQCYQTSFIHYLIKKGFAVNDKVFFTAVQYSGDLEMIAFLAKYVDIKSVDYNGNCVLHYAHNPQLIDLLARIGAPINQTNHAAMTPIIRAILMCSSIETIESLLFWGSDGKKLDLLFDLDKNINFSIPKEVYDSFILYGMSVSVNCESVKNFVSQFLDCVTQGWSISTMTGVLRHIFLSNDINTIPEELKRVVEVRSLLGNYKKELNDMKNIFITDNVTYYQFCMKRYKSITSPFADKVFTESDYQNLKNLFPTFYNEVMVKIKINTRINKKKSLSRKLMDVTFGVRKSKGNNSNDDEDEYITLDCYSMYDLSLFLSERDIKSLLAASIID